MKEYIRKIGLLGIGIAALTKEKADALVDELIKKGELSQEEGRALVEDLMKKSEENSRELKNRIDRDVSKALERLDVASKKDIKYLERKIDKLEKALKG